MFECFVGEASLWGNFLGVAFPCGIFPCGTFLCRAFSCRTSLCKTLPSLAERTSAEPSLLDLSLRNFSCRSCPPLQNIPLPSFLCGNCPRTTLRSRKFSFQSMGTELSENGLGSRPCATVFQASVSSSGTRVQNSIHGHRDITQSSKATNSRRRILDARWITQQCLYDPGRTRTCNPRLCRPMPYPLGHGARYPAEYQPSAVSCFLAA